MQMDIQHLQNIQEIQRFSSYASQTMEDDGKPKCLFLRTMKPDTITSELH